MFSKLLENIGYRHKDDESYFMKCLREEAMKWACVLGVPECRKNATLQLERQLRNDLMSEPDT